MAKTYEVTIRFQFPAWDEVNGIQYTIDAESKAEAIKDARHQARNDGHTGHGGKGNVYVSAKEI